LLEAAPDSPEAVAFAAHLESCAECQDALDRLVATDPDATPTGDSSGGNGPDAATRGGDDFLRELERVPPDRYPVTLALDGAEPPPGPPDLAGYEVSGVLGRGGMGVVYRTRQLALGRDVAIKMIAADTSESAAVAARFEVERQALALMDHPNIARVFDAGITGGGQPYIVMELAEGVPITEYSDAHRLTVEERLELFIPVCQAVQHAHQKGIIHRDLKPSNVLVTLADGRPVPKVIDFGVAKSVDRRLTERTLCTQPGAVVGTVEYMSPEQAELGALDVDTRSDTYALGVLLYELVTGTTPLERDRIRESAFGEVLRRIREEEPQPPSVRLSGSPDALPAIAARRGTEPARLVKLVRGSLDWIVLRALEKDRTRRYETANGLARDVQRYLAGDPVETGPPSTAYRLGKLARKHRALIATAAMFVALLVAGLIISAVLAIRATRAERQSSDDRSRAIAAERAARTEADKALAINRFLTGDLLIQASPEHNPADSKVTLLEALDRAAEKVGDGFRGQPDVEAAIRRTIAEAYHGLGRYDKSERHWRAVAEIERRRSGPESVETSKAESEIGHMLRHSGQVGEALGLLEKAHVGLRRSLGPDHIETLRAADHLARAYQGAGRLDDALPLFRETLRRHRANLGPDHPHTLVAMNNLADAYWAANRLNEALPLLEESLRGLRAKLGPDHPDTLNAMDNLAAAYEVDGRLDQALPLFEESLERQRAKLGPDHRSTLLTMNNLAAAWWRARRLDRSVPLFEETLKLQESKLGPDDVDTLRTLANLGINYKDAGRLEEGIERIESARERARKRFGQVPVEFAAFSDQLVDAYHRAGRLAKAEAICRERIEQARRQFGPPDPRTTAAIAALGMNLLNQAKWAEAESTLRESLALREKTQPDDWSVSNTRSLLGESLLGRGRYAEAEPLLLSGYEGLRAREARIPAFARALRLSEAGERILRLYDAWGQPEQAAAWKARLGLADLPADVFAGS
jgi:serine/threonine protein kinase/tetratricopeptide (TPR) repeat protein